MLLLHSFEYPSAADAFREAQRQDPGFALAYWGEALTHNHPVWNQQALDSARAILARLAPTREARAARASTPRERDWLNTVEILYGEGSKARRDTLYAAAMERLMAAYPDDHEARAFTALALLGLSQAVRSVPAYMRAAALVAPVFAANPDHPGAAHYLIHAFDDPVHAPLGLPAAHAYSRIAPDAAHAQHMTTHIFLALGMWDETIAQNVLAANQTAYVPGHYTLWLAYGYQQAGRFRDAAQLLDRVRAGMRRPSQRGPLAFMRAHHVTNTEQWTGPAADWTLDLAGVPHAAPVDAYVRGLIAWKRGNVAALSAAVAELGRWADSARAGGDSLQQRRLFVMEGQLRAMQDLSRDAAGAVQRLRSAAAFEGDLPMEFGPPEIIKPTNELLGEVYLSLSRPAEAQLAFTRALELAPGRARSLIGLVRSAAAAGDRATAERAWRQLAASWHAADEEVQVLRELRPLIASR